MEVSAVSSRREEGGGRKGGEERSTVASKWCDQSRVVRSFSCLGSAAEEEEFGGRFGAGRGSEGGLQVMYSLIAVKMAKSGCSMVPPPQGISCTLPPLVRQ